LVGRVQFVLRDQPFKECALVWKASEELLSQHHRRPGRRAAQRGVVLLNEHRRPVALRECVLGDDLPLRVEHQQVVPRETISHTRLPA